MSPYSILVEKGCDFSGVVFATKTSASFWVVAENGSIFLEINPLSDDPERLFFICPFFTQLSIKLLTLSASKTA